LSAKSWKKLSLRIALEIFDDRKEDYILELPHADRQKLHTEGHLTTTGDPRCKYSVGSTRVVLTPGDVARTQ